MAEEEGKTAEESSNVVGGSVRINPLIQGDTFCNEINVENPKSEIQRTSKQSVSKASRKSVPRKNESTLKKTEGISILKPTKGAQKQKTKSAKKLQVVLGAKAMIQKW